MGHENTLPPRRPTSLLLKRARMWCDKLVDPDTPAGSLAHAAAVAVGLAVVLVASVLLTLALSAVFDSIPHNILGVTRSSDALVSLSAGSARESPSGARVMIVQLNAYRPGHAYYATSRRSVVGHERYAAAHGYGYRRQELGLIEQPEGVAHFDRITAYFAAVVEELDSEKGAEWIYFTNTDSWIVDPAIALNDLLPPPTLESAPLVLGTENFYSWHPSPLLYRVSEDTAGYLATRLEKLYPSGAAEEEDIEDDIGETHSTVAVTATPTLIGTAVEVPQCWLGCSLNLHSTAANVRKGEEDPSSEEVQLAVHLFGTVKWRTDYDALERHIDTIYRRGQKAARRQGIEGSGLELLGQSDEAREVASRFWTARVAGTSGEEKDDGLVAVARGRGEEQVYFGR